MKGILKSKDEKWVVSHCCGRCNGVDDICSPTENLLHPKDFYSDLLVGEYGEVEFEIVEETLTNLDGVSKSYKFAKLIQCDCKVPNNGVPCKIHGFPKFIPKIHLDINEEETTWDDIERDYINTNFFEDFREYQNWLKENYNPPVKK